MRYTPNLNLPVAEDTDMKDDFPLNVDGPAKDILDDELAQFGTPGTRIVYGVAQTDGAGEYTFTWDAGVWASVPRYLLTAIEKTGVSLRIRGGATTTTATVRADDNASNPSTSCYFNYMVIGSRGTAPHPDL